MKRLATCVTLGAVLASAAPAFALRVIGPTRPRPVASLETYNPYINSDGRYLALNNGRGGTTLYDTLRERTRTIPGCSVQDGVDARFLTACRSGRNPDGTPHLVQRFYFARSKRFLPIEGATESDGFHQLGRHWLLGWAATNDAHDSQSVYFNWRTHERVLCGAFVNPDCDDFSYDIDHTGLVWRSDDLVEYEAPDRLTIKGRQSGKNTSPRPLVFNRKVLAHVICRVDTACSPSLDDGLVSWVDNRPGTTARVHGYSAESKRRATWRITRPRDALLRAIHTDYGVGVWVCAPRARCDTESQRWRVYFLPWPRNWRRGDPA